MKKLLLLFLPLVLCTCISRDYRYYVDRGDRILEGFPADSPAHLRYTSDEMCTGSFYIAISGLFNSFKFTK